MSPGPVGPAPSAGPSGDSEDAGGRQSGIQSASRLIASHGRYNVVFVLRTVPPYRVPFLSELSNSVPALDLTVVSATGVEEPGKLATVAEISRFRMVRVNAWQTQLSRFTLIWIALGPRRLEKLAPDVLVLEGSFGILSHVPLCLWARFKGRKVIFWVSGWSKPTTRGFAKWIRESYMRAALRLGHGVVTYSSRGAEWLRSLGVPSDRLRVAQNTLDVEMIAARALENAEAGSALRELLGLGKAPVMVSVGALTPDKRLDRLLDLHEELWARKIPVHTVIVGGGPESAALAARAANLTGVHLVGPVIQGVEAYFSLADLFVLPGLGGLAINQASACGVPVLCSVADGTEADLVLDGVTGFYRPTFDRGEWADLAESILLNPTRRQDMGTSARSHVLHAASLGGMCESFLWSFCSVLGLTSSERTEGESRPRPQ